MNLATAITVEENVTFADSNYEYVTNVAISVTTLEVTAGEFYLDNTAFCLWGQVAKFTTARVCPTYPALESTKDDLLSKFSGIPMWIGLIIMVFFAMLILKLWHGNVLDDEIVVFLIQIMAGVIALVIGMIIIAALFA